MKAAARSGARWAALFGAVLVVGAAPSPVKPEAAGDPGAVEGAAGTEEPAPPTPRRPRRVRPEVDLRFPEPALPRGRLRPPRPDPDALAAYLGPVPKTVVVGEGTPLSDLSRLAAVPNVRIGVATRGGNALHPEDLRRLRRLPSVDLYLDLPLLDVHLEVLSEVETVAGVSLRVPPGGAVDEATLERLRRTGPGRRHLVLEGETDRARLAALSGLSGLSRIVLAFRLPDAGLDAPTGRLVEALGLAGVEVRVPAGADPEAVAGLAALGVDGLVLETEGNRLRSEVREAAEALGVRIRVRLDGRVGREDLRHLKGLARLELVVWLGDRTDVPVRITELLTESEGIRPRRTGEDEPRPPR